MRKIDVAKQLVANLKEMYNDISSIGNVMITLGLPGAYHVNTITIELDKMIKELRGYIKRVEDAFTEVGDNAESVGA